EDTAALLTGGLLLDRQVDPVDVARWTCGGRGRGKFSGRPTDGRCRGFLRFAFGYARLNGYLVGHPVRLQQISDVDVRGIGHEAEAKAGAGRPVGLKLRIERSYRVAQNGNLGLGVARIGQ